MPDARLCVIGGGPAGTAAALRAAHLGAEVVLIERGRVGGTAHRGAVPLAALSAAANLRAGAMRWGLAAAQAGVDLAMVRAEADQRVEADHAELRAALAGAGVTVLTGDAWLTSAEAVGVATSDGELEVSAPTIVLAPGAGSVHPPWFDARLKGVLDPMAAVRLTDLPREMIVVGAGTVGCAVAAALAGLGVRVRLIEGGTEILSGEHVGARSAVAAAFADREVDLRLGRAVVGCSRTDAGVEVTLDDGSTVEAEAVIAAVGTAPDTADLGLEELGVSRGERGHIAVDARGHTGAGDIYAAGDAVATPRLTHVAYAEGIAAVEAALDGTRLVDPALVPRVLYTTPEVASVGMAADVARGAGREVSVATGGVGACEVAEPGAFCELVIETATDRVLGATLVGPGAAEAVHAVALAVGAGIGARELAMVVAPGGLAEATMRAAQVAHGLTIRGPLPPGLD